MKLLVTSIFLVALLLIGVIATETRLLFYWPGCALLGVAGLLAGLRWRLKLNFPPSDLCLISVAVVTLYLLARAWLSPVEIYAREDIFILLGCFVAYLLTATVVSHPRWRSALMVVLVLLTVGNLAVGFIHFSGSWKFHIIPHFVRTFEAGRIGGFYNNPNHLAAFLSFVVMLSAGLMFFGRGGASMKLLLGFLAVASVIGIALTESRGALLGLAGGGVVFAGLGFGLVWKTQRHLFVKLLAGVVVLAALGSSVLYLVAKEKLEKRSMNSPATQDVRLLIWKSAMQQNALQPATGAGARMFYDHCATLRLPEQPTYSPEPQFAHSEYVQMLADYGWVGLVLLALMLLIHLSHGISYVRWFARERFPLTGLLQSHSLAFAMGALGALVATAIHAGFEFHFHVAATAITAAVLLGMLANPGFDSDDHRAMKVPGARSMSKLVLIAASLWMLAGAVQYGPADWYAAKGAMATKADDMKARLDWYSKAIDRDVTNPEHLYQRGLAYMEQWKPELPESVSKRLLGKAVVDLETACRLNPYHYLYPLALADAYDALRREDDALKQVQLALKLAPLYEETRMALGIHYQRWGKNEEALKAYKFAESAGYQNTNDEVRWLDFYFPLKAEMEKKAKP